MIVKTETVAEINNHTEILGELLEERVMRLKRITAVYARMSAVRRLPRELSEAVEDLDGVNENIEFRRDEIKRLQAIYVEAIK